MAEELTVEASLNIIKDSLDAQDAVIDRLQSRMKRDEIGIAAVGLIAGLGMFGTWQTMKAVRTIAQTLGGLGQVVQQMIGQPIQAHVPTEAQAPATNGTVPFSPAAPPAEAPSSGVSEAMREAMASDPVDASEAVRGEGVE